MSFKNYIPIEYRGTITYYCAIYIVLIHSKKYIYEV